MQYVEIETLGYDLLREHRLTDWSLELVNIEPHVGECDFACKTIRIRTYAVHALDGKEAEDTILHEIAHALVGPGHDHDEVWQAKAKALGVRIEAVTTCD